MSGVEIEIDVDAMGALRSLAKIEDRAKNQRPVLEHARELLKKANAENFASNGLPVGGWAPLDAEYGAWKSVRFPGSPIMVRTGRLFRDLTTLRGPGNIIGKDFATFRTTVKYAKFHQYGTSKMPKREIMFEPRGFARDLAKYSRKYIIDGEIVASIFG